jgi:hypothetical protein
MLNRASNLEFLDKRPKLQGTDIRSGTRNRRVLYRTDSLMTVSEEHFSTPFLSTAYTSKENS